MNKVIVRKVDEIENDLPRLLDEAYRFGWLASLFGSEENRKDNPSDKPKKIVVKPNLCTMASSESGIISDLKVVKTLVAFFRKKVPGSEIIIVESDSFDRDAEEAFCRLGYTHIAEEGKVKVINLSKAEYISLSIPKIPYELNLPEMFMDNFFFISLANLKTHDYQKITCIFKNQFGCIPDRLKERYHPYLEEVLNTLDELVRPDLCIVDGRMAMEGNGPVDGEPIKTNAFIIGNSSIAVDTVCAQLMGFDPKNVPYLRYAYNMRKYDYRNISVIGDDMKFKFSFIPNKLYFGIRFKIFITRASILTTNFLKKLSFNLIYFGFISTLSRLPKYIKKKVG